MVSWSKVDDFYRKPAWKSFSKAFLKAHPWCSVPGCGQMAAHADHKTPISRGGAGLDPNNVQALCIGHHNQKSALQRSTRPSKRQRLTVLGCDIHGNPLDPLAAWNTDKR